MSKNIQYLFFLFVLLVAVGLKACATAESDLEENSDNAFGIEGLWDTSRARDQNLLDVSYMHIDSTGRFTIYNYLGDDYDKTYSDWGDCYFIQRERTGIYTHLEGNNYKVTYVSSEHWTFDNNSLDRTYDVRKGAEKLGTLKEIQYSEDYLSAYIDQNGELVGTTGGSTSTIKKASKTVEELENYTRCPYSD